MCPVFQGCDPWLVFAASGTKDLGIRRPKAGWVRGLGWRLSAFVQRLKDGRCRSGAGRAGRRRQRQGDRRPPLPVSQWGRCGALRLRRAEGAGPRGRADGPLSKVPQWQRVRSCAGAPHCSGRGSGRASAQAPPGAARGHAHRLFKAAASGCSRAVAGGRWQDARGLARPLPRGSPSPPHNAGGEAAGALCRGDACVRRPPGRAPRRARKVRQPVF